MNAMCAIRRRLAREERDAGTALLLVIFVVLVLSALSLLILGTITSRVRPVVAAEKRAVTLSAAEAGLQAGLGAIKNSISVDPTDAGNVKGDRNLLPCWAGQNGSVSVSDTNVNYATTITYFMNDPSRQTDAWRVANKMTCNPGYGPTTGAPNYSLPKFALVSADGVGPAIKGNADLGNRRMEGVYTFSLSNANISGGSMGWGNLCFDAGSSPYAAGRQVVLRTCDSSLFSQMWSHRDDFTVQLSETTSSGGAGLCLQMDATTAASTTAMPVRLAVCDSSRATQRWGFNDGRALYARPTNVWTDGLWCANNAGGNLVAGPRNGTCPSLDASPKIGAGAAGTVTDDVDGRPLQWVNYKRFGRCYDITDWRLNSSAYPTGRPSEILYNCKQDPMRASEPRAQPGWNQVFTWDAATKRFFNRANVNADGQPVGTNMPYSATFPMWCMRSPNSNNGYVNFDSACTSTLPQFQWTVNRNTGNNATAYTIVDGFGRCLAAGDGNPAYPAGYQQYFSVVTATCDGTTGQKWNAPPIVSDVPVTNVRERVIS